MSFYILVLVLAVTFQSPQSSSQEVKAKQMVSCKKLPTTSTECSTISLFFLQNSSTEIDLQRTLHFLCTSCCSQSGVENNMNTVYIMSAAALWFHLYRATTTPQEWLELYPLAQAHRPYYYRARQWPCSWSGGEKNYLCQWVPLPMSWKGHLSKQINQQQLSNIWTWQGNFSRASITSSLPSAYLRWLSSFSC